MARRIKTLTEFGKDLDSLLEKAGKLTLREYADECGVNYKYLSQLRTIPKRRPGRLYVDLLKPFVRLQIIGLDECQRLSLRHRDRPISSSECRELFPDFSENELEDSIKQAIEGNNLYDSQLTDDNTVNVKDAKETSQPEKYQSLYRRVFVGRQSELNELKLAFDAAVARH